MLKNEKAEKWHLYILILKENEKIGKIIAPFWLIFSSRSIFSMFQPKLETY